MAAKKSKTQQAKASARRQARKAAAAELEEKGITPVEENKPKSTKAETKKKPKKERFKFLKSVKAEMKRVTWPTRTEVLRWSAVVVGALIFFGVFVAVLDNLIVTPVVYGISSLRG